MSNTVVNRGDKGTTVSPPGRRRGDTGAFRGHPCLQRDKPFEDPRYA